MEYLEDRSAEVHSELGAVLRLLESLEQRVECADCVAHVQRDRCRSEPSVGLARLLVCEGFARTACGKRLRSSGKVTIDVNINKTTRCVCVAGSKRIGGATADMSWMPIYT